MGKGTKKKTVWRTFSFENGNTNGTDINKNASSPADRSDYGQENKPITSSNGTVTNGKFVTNWRDRRYQSNGNENLSSENESHDSDLTKSKDFDGKHATGYGNGFRHHYYHSNNNRPYYKRWPLSDKQFTRNGFRKFTTENGNCNAIENADDGTQTEYRDNYENDTNHTQSNQFIRSNRAPFNSNRHFNGGYRKWDNRTYNYHHHSNGFISSYNRGFRKPNFAHSDHAAFSRNNNDHYYDKNGSTENGLNGHNATDCDQNETKMENNHNSTSQQTHNDHQNDHQNQEPIKINEDEYTRISTPRSEVLFKKGYLMRAKKYVGSSTTATVPTSSNDSGSVSVVSNEETASYYSIQSTSPENTAFVNGTNGSDGTSVTYPGDGYNPDVPLIFSSGFYDNNGYFYVNPYVPHFDQYNGTIGLMPFDNTTTTNGAYSAYTSPSPPAMNADAKSVDGDHLNEYNKQHSINSEDVSTSSFSENVSINNDSVTPQSPLTPPPSPLSPTDSNDKTTESEENGTEISVKIGIDGDNLTESNQSETETETETTPVDTMPNQINETDNAELTESETVIPENYSVPYYSPFIFVPPIPFVPGGHMTHPRRNRFYRRYSNNYYNRFRKYNRFSHYHDKFYVPTNWSDAPDETTINIVQDSTTNDTQIATDIEKSNDIVATPTLEQCDIILKNSKLNSNVSEFIPQNKRMVAVPVQIAPESPSQASTQVLPSQLNVNVPEFLPKNYKPLLKANDGKVAEHEDSQHDALEKQDLKIASYQNDEIINREANETSSESKCIQKTTENDFPIDTVQKSIANCATKDEEGDKVTVRTLSDLLKSSNNNTNNSNTNINSSSSSPSPNNNTNSKNEFSLSRTDNCKQNSHINSKADIGNKYRNKIWYNRNNNDNKNNTDNDLNINNNKMTKIQNAYPNMKRNHHRGESSRLNHVDSKIKTQNEIKTKTNGVSGGSGGSGGLSYAQMVVPIKMTADQSNGIPPQNQSPSKLRSINNNNINNNKTIAADKSNRKSTPKKKVIIEPVKSNDGPIEWFTIGAKGKKQALANDKQNLIDFTTNLTQNTKEEQMNEIAEELQLDIKKDSDLAMDIMDSLAISEAKQTKNQLANQIQKKKMATKTSKKKSIKDKTNKESKRKRSETFDIIEPNFEIDNKKNTTENDETHIDVKSEKTKDIAEQSESNELTFDPNVFTTPLNLQQADRVQEKLPNIGNTCNSLRLSANKSIRSLNNSFDIYHPDYVSIENQQLQQEEEMVNKVLQQLKISVNSDDKEDISIETKIEIIATNNEITNETSNETCNEICDEICNEICDETCNEISNELEIIPSDAEVDEKNDSDSGSSSIISINFDINAKPQQNAYSSNHFLGHFFGDKNDKRDPVENSAILSSSDQLNSMDTAEELDKSVNSDQDNRSINTDHSTEHKSENVNVNEEYDSEASVEALNEIIERISENKFDQTASEDDVLNELKDLNISESECQQIEQLSCSDNDFQFDEINEIKQSERGINEIVQKMGSVVDQPIESLPIDSEVNDSHIEAHKIAELKVNPGINLTRPWIRIVDTQMLEKQKKLQKTFPITRAVSMWLNQAQKEKTPEPILRLPLKNSTFFAANAQTTKRTKINNQTSQYCSSVGTEHYYNADYYSSDETSSIASDKEKLTLDLTSIDDDEEEDIMNFWELEGSTSSHTPQTPPIYNSVYGNSINYANLLSNKNELLCNNIINFEQIDVSNDETMSTTTAKANGLKQGQTPKVAGTDENYFKPAPEVCCTIM